MNSQVPVLTTSKSNISEEQPLVMMLQRITQYTIYAGLGLVGGGIGVILTIGLAIIIQAQLGPTTPFWPGIIPLTVVATLMGAGVSWLIGRGIIHLLSSLFYNVEEHAMQTILIFGVLTSLLEIFLFTYGL